MTSKALGAFYTEVFGLQVAMETPVMGLQAPDLTSAQVIICPRGFENLQPDFGIDVGDPEAVDRAHARVHNRGLRVVYPLTDEPWGVRRFFRGGPRWPHHQRPRAPPQRVLKRHSRRAYRTTGEESIAGPALLARDD